jgi:hypothetical protein
MTRSRNHFRVVLERPPCIRTALARPRKSGPFGAASKVRILSTQDRLKIEERLRHEGRL